MGLLEDVLAVGLQAGLSLSATSLTYTREGFLPEAIDGTQGKRTFKIQEPGQPTIYVKSVDFLIQVADLKINGALTKPVEGDEIARVIGSTRYVYKVLPPSRETPFFDYSDPGKTVFRIHTKLFTEESV